MLDGAVNFSSWKARIVLILQEKELWDIVNNTTAHPVTFLQLQSIRPHLTNKTLKQKDSRIILDAIKDHVIPHISGKYYALQIWTSLTNLYQSSNENRKMLPRENLKSTQMNKGENIVSYL